MWSNDERMTPDFDHGDLQACVAMMQSGSKTFFCGQPFVAFARACACDCPLCLLSRCR